MGTQVVSIHSLPLIENWRSFLFVLESNNSITFSENEKNSERIQKRNLSLNPTILKHSYITSQGRFEALIFVVNLHHKH